MRFLDQKPQHIYALIFCGALATLPFLGIVFPRIFAYIPAVIGVLGVLAYRPVFGRFPLFCRPAFFAMLGLVVLMALSIFWAFDSVVTIERLLKAMPVLFGGALLFSLCLALDDAVRKIFQKFFPLAVIAAGVLCVFELYTGAPIYCFFHESAATNIVPDLSFFNRSSVIFILCGLVALFILYQGEGNKILMGVLSFLILAALYKTDSQSVQLAVLVAAILYFLFPYSRPKAWYGLGILLIAALALAPWMAQSLFQNAVPLIADMSWFQNSYATSRLEIWDFIADRALERPLMGFGMEAARAMNDFNTAELYYESGTVLHPHNFALQIWIEFGALGIVFTAGFFSYVLARIYEAGPVAARFFLPLFFACISMASTSYGLWQGWWLGLFWLLAGYSVLAVQTRTR